jgi:hypothetical protein
MADSQLGLGIGRPSLSIPGWRKEDGRPAAEAPAVRPKKKTLRGWLEFGGFMVGSGINYWIKYAHYVEDWQWKLTLWDQWNRFLTLGAIRFDSNSFVTNWIHCPGGALYYQFARTNNFSWTSSWLVAAIGAAYWEYVAEWREVISINDLITTTSGGYSMGEPWYQLGEYFAHKPGAFYGLLSFMNPLLKFHHWLDRKDLGANVYTPPGWERCSLVVGAKSAKPASGGASETSLFLGVRTQLVEFPDYGKPGEIRTTLKDTFVSEMSGDYAYRDHYVDEANLTTRVVSWGLFRQSINENLEGYAFSLGLGSALEYFKKRPVDFYDINPQPFRRGVDLHLERPRNFRDKLVLVHVAGPVVDWTIFRRDLKLRTVVEVYGDFGLINAYALNGYSALHNIAGMKSTLLYYGNYYGFGGSVSAATDLWWGNFRARGQASFGAWGSADFSDRYQDDVTNNLHFDDNMFVYLVGIGYKIPRLPFELFADYQGRRRWGRADDFRTHGLEKRLFAGLEFLF